jgi:hypothetical protein
MNVAARDLVADSPAKAVDRGFHEPLLVTPKIRHGCDRHPLRREPDRQIEIIGILSARLSLLRAVHPGPRGRVAM